VAQGRAVQVDPIQPTLKVPGVERLKLKYDKLLSNVLQFCFNLAYIFNVRRYSKDVNIAGCMRRWREIPTAVKNTLFESCNHGQGLTLVHYSAQPEPFMAQNTPQTLPDAPRHPPHTPWTTPT